LWLLAQPEQSPNMTQNAKRKMQSILLVDDVLSKLPGTTTINRNAGCPKTRAEKVKKSAQNLL